ncbi:Cytidylate kinase-like family protein [Desulfatibacillum alkenivorans DSM 16219]|jgi:cytidylate kinase|uniref:Cytidylate kinase-like family protein n=1 Tax=Desulfatibacillum alkenivorans DSM 16219 TaxID=1121393 RepID=A0A1M6XQ07_9BACT|nr:cytidylate kinase family protein [Desulfatibacillum alkenivorans]SHL07993.1 Cytidylate kinase-like family protein [Desulfatibacillum alkenivorans DSM 16219]
MASIIISSDSSLTAARIAEKIAEKGGFSVVNRDILPETAQKYDVDVAQLKKALDKPAGIFGMPAKLKKQCMTYIQAVALEKLLPDNIVCYGLGAHLYAKGVSHFFKVRVLTRPEQLIKELHPAGTAPENKAEKIIAKHEKARNRWSRDVFKQDESNAGLYDLVISLNQIEEEEAVKMILETAALRQFEPMTYSINCVKEFLMAAQVKAKLVERFPDCRVRVDGENTVIHIQALKRNAKKYSAVAKEAARTVPGVKHVEVHILTDFIGQAVESNR